MMSVVDAAVLTYAAAPVTYAAMTAPAPVTYIAAPTYTSASVTYAAAPETYAAAAPISLIVMEPTRYIYIAAPTYTPAPGRKVLRIARILRLRLSVRVVRPLLEFSEKLGVGEIEAMRLRFMISLPCSAYDYLSHN